MASSTTAPAVASSLLDLPGELRNMIYAYALSTGPRKTINLSAGSADRQINQLKYVCRQLHNETRQLEYKLNTVEIIGFATHTQSNLWKDTDPLKAKTVILDLTRMLEPSKLSWLTNVTLSNHIPRRGEGLGVKPTLMELTEMASTILHLDGVFKSMPALRVRYNISTFCKETLLREHGGEEPEWNAIFHGLFLTSMLRNEPLTDLRLKHPKVASRERSLMWRVRCLDVVQAVRLAPLEKKKRWAESIRFFPNPDIVIAESFAPGRDSFALSLAKVQGLLPSWKALVERWLAEGI